MNPARRRQQLAPTKNISTLCEYLRGELDEHPEHIHQQHARARLLGLYRLLERLEREGWLDPEP